MDHKKLFDRAYRKASQMRPGAPDPLTPLESKELLESIEFYQEKKDWAFGEFQEAIIKQYPEMSELDIKLLFKQRWAREFEF